MFETQKITEDEKNVLEKYKSLKRLSLNDVGLTSLENFPELNELMIVRIILFFNIIKYLFSLNYKIIN